MLAAGNEILVSFDEGDYVVSSLPTAGDLTGIGVRTIKVPTTLVPGVVRQDGYPVIDVF